MIYTITTNPSLDYTVETELIPGQVNRTRSEVIYPGGKGINVSISLQRLGQETRVLGFAAGRIGQTIRDLLDDLGCSHTLLELSGGGQSRINVKFRGAVETAVNGRGPDLGEADMAKLLELLREVGTEDAVVLSGWAQSIPFYVSILQQVVATGCMTVLDCTGESLWQCLGCRPFLVKPNLMELGALFRKLGFARIKFCTPQVHDRMIAYTSQLPHVMSNSYVKSPAAGEQEGFAGGSCRDMSRTACLNERMWTELFLLNRKHLLPEIDCLLASMEELRAALEEGDAAELERLLRRGREDREKALAANCPGA